MKVSRKEYLKKFQRGWLKNRRLAWISENGPCKLCGSSESLEVDHINREDKEMNPSTVWSRRKEVRDKELAKCQVLCEKCHLEKSNKEMSSLFKGIKKLHMRIVSDEQIGAILWLINQGCTEREACAQIGIARGTFSAIKIKKERPELFV